ncbi:MAG: anti-sigma F factor [Clostridia bacterium]|nr:anti-sigma F factor [Clostridia bacterium]
MNNRVKIDFLSVSENEGFARIAAAAFVSQLNPTLEELDDIKTAVSEAVTNAIIHGYENRGGTVTLLMEIEEKCVKIQVIDKGRGIDDIKKAMQPLYTSKPDLERSGMGFTVMESFMDSLEVSSETGKGTKVLMTKRIM